MEKRAPGFSPETGDWLFMEIDRQGKVPGISEGPDADRVRFCGACHVKPGRARGDLCYMPEAVRAR